MPVVFGSISDAETEALTRAKPQLLLAGIELYSPVWGTPQRIVDDNISWTVTLESLAPRNPSQSVLYNGIPFEYIGVSQDEGSQVPVVKCRINDVTGLLRQPILDVLSGRDVVDMVYRTWLKSSPGVIQTRNYNLQAELFQMPSGVISVEFRYEQFHKALCPNDVYRTDEFQTLNA